MKCFYHSADLDGHCSGAIIKHFFPECEMMPINYGEVFPWSKVAHGEVVFMVDFSLQPFGAMKTLAEECDLHWIDHHKTAIDEAEKIGFRPNGIQRVGMGACILTWQYLFAAADQITPGIEIFPCHAPLVVRLLGQYDVWDHLDGRTVPLQYRLRMEDLDPRNPTAMHIWKVLFGKDCLDELVYQGHLLMSYQRQQDYKFCQSYAFETQLDAPRGILFDPRNGDPAFPYRAICANRGLTNSKIFDSIFDPATHDIMITFCRLKPPARKWTVSLYSTKDEIDCGAIAKVFGGGGHKGAAGFRCEELPFQI